MTRLQLSWEWEQAQAVRGAELRATWARLSILIGSECVTQIHDHSTRGVRDGIYGPLYPIAEWLLSNWWPLLYEPDDDARRQSGFEQRHSFRFSDEGYATPDLQLVPVGETLLAQWKRRHLPDQRVTFLSSGSALLERLQVEEELGKFVQAVAHRLADRTLKGSFVQDEWATLQGLETEEREFCVAAGSMGLDPLFLPPESEDQIVVACDMVPEDLRSEFFSSARLDDLSVRGRWIEDALAAIARRQSQAGDLRGLCDSVNRRFSPQGPPWQQGYQLARIVRDILAIGTDRVDLQSLGSIDCDRDVIWDRQTPNRVDGLVGLNSESAPAFQLRQKQRADSQRFVVCRAIGELIACSVNGGMRPALLTSAATARQKLNRAFAAELLAPADGLRSRINGDFVSDEVLEDVAEDLAVSSQVIRYQVRNHNLARLEN